MAWGCTEFLPLPKMFSWFSKVFWFSIRKSFLIPYLNLSVYNSSSQLLFLHTRHMRSSQQPSLQQTLLQLMIICTNPGFLLFPCSLQVNQPKSFSFPLQVTFSVLWLFSWSSSQPFTVISLFLEMQWVLLLVAVFQLSLCQCWVWWKDHFMHLGSYVLFSSSCKCWLILRLWLTLFPHKHCYLIIIFSILF